MIFIDLPVPAKKALIHYYVIDGCSPEFDSLVDSLEMPIPDAGWKSLIALADQVWADRLYKISTLSLEAAIHHVWDNSPSLQEEYASFEEYHKWYVDGGDIPDHTSSDWPVLSSPDGSEALLDGWHRFHSYVKQGFSNVHILHI